MNKIEIEGGKPILSWCMSPEDGAIAQAANLAKLPFIVSHVALMPDTHQGYGMPIGGVIACDGVVIPNAVGVDIGCGMCAVETDLAGIETETLKDIMGKIREAIPTGFNRHKGKQDRIPLWDGSGLIVGQEYEKAHFQIGTLGGGNHFIEIQKSQDRIWVMLHSGSRNIGLKVAKHYNDKAKALNESWHVSVDPKADLAFLPLDSEAGKEYLREMDYCLEFAQASRALMMSRIMNIFSSATHCNALQSVNIHHNYARMEHHQGRDLMVHRKGATSARAGELGIIPGSQGTASYIVRGKGNKASFESCSHGAGRRMGRKEAERTLDLAAEKSKMDALGVIHAVRGTADLDEAPGAYKDIATVMDEQRDLVDVVVELKPLGVIKAASGRR